MIKEIAKHLDQVDLNINVSKSGDKLIVSVLPKPKTDDPAKEQLTPFVVSGEDYEQVENTLMECLTESLPKVAEITNSMNHYLDGVKEMEAKSKMKEKAKKEAKDIEDKIKKKLEGFDKLIEENLDEAEKVVNAVVKLNPNSSKSIKAKADLAKAKSESAGDLFSVHEEKAQVVIPSSPMSEEQIEMIENNSNSNKTIYI